MAIFALFDSEGFIKQFFEDIGSVKIPSHAIEVTAEERSNIVYAPQQWRYDGEKVIAYTPPPVAPQPPQSLTLASWRAGLDLWLRDDGAGHVVSRLSDVTTAVRALLATGTPVGKVAFQQLEYANTVQLTTLLMLKDAFGFTEAECAESMWRAARVDAGDYSGVWPLSEGSTPPTATPPATTTPITKRLG